MIFVHESNRMIIRKQASRKKIAIYSSNRIIINDMLRFIDSEYFIPGVIFFNTKTIIWKITIVQISL